MSNEIRPESLGYEEGQANQYSFVDTCGFNLAIRVNEPPEGCTYLEHALTSLVGSAALLFKCLRADYSLGSAVIVKLTHTSVEETHAAVFFGLLHAARHMPDALAELDARWEEPALRLPDFDGYLSEVERLVGVITDAWMLPNDEARRERMSPAWFADAFSSIKSLTYYATEGVELRQAVLCSDAREIERMTGIYQFEFSSGSKRYPYPVDAEMVLRLARRFLGERLPKKREDFIERLAGAQQMGKLFWRDDRIPGDMVDTERYDPALESYRLTKLCQRAFQRGKFVKFAGPEDLIAAIVGRTARLFNWEKVRRSPNIYNSKVEEDHVILFLYLHYLLRCIAMRYRVHLLPQLRESWQTRIAGPLSNTSLYSVARLRLMSGVLSLFELNTALQKGELEPSVAGKYVAGLIDLLRFVTELQTGVPFCQSVARVNRKTLRHYAEVPFEIVTKGGEGEALKDELSELPVRLDHLDRLFEFYFPRVGKKLSRREIRSRWKPRFEYLLRDKDHHGMEGVIWVLSQQREKTKRELEEGFVFRRKRLPLGDCVRWQRLSIDRLGGYITPFGPVAKGHFPYFVSFFAAAMIGEAGGLFELYEQGKREGKHDQEKIEDECFDVFAYFLILAILLEWYTGGRVNLLSLVEQEWDAPVPNSIKNEEELYSELRNLMAVLMRFTEWGSGALTPEHALALLRSLKRVSLYLTKLPWHEVVFRFHVNQVIRYLGRRITVEGLYGASHLLRAMAALKWVRDMGWSIPRSRKAEVHRAAKLQAQERRKFFSLPVEERFAHWQGIRRYVIDSLEEARMLAGPSIWPDEDPEKAAASFLRALSESIFSKEERAAFFQ